MASDLEAGSDAEWRAYLHEQYKSHRDEYTTLIRDQPTLAAERLLDLFASDDPAILQFLAQFLLNIDKPQEERDVLWPIMEALWLSGFPLALLHVLSDRKWYEAAKVVIEPNLELNISTLSAVCQFVMAAKCLVLFTDMTILRAPKTELLQLCERFPAFWEVIWDYRSVVFSDQLSRLSPNAKYHIASIQKGYFILFHEAHSNNPPLSNYFGHTLFLVWFNYNPTVPSPYSVPEYLTSSIMLLNLMLEAENTADRANGTSRVETWISEILPAVVGSTDVAEVFLRGLNSRDRIMLLDFQAYMNTLNVLGYMQTCYPSVENPRRRAENLRRILVAHEIAVAARHYECHGGSVVKNEGQREEIAIAFITLYGSSCNGVNVKLPPKEFALLSTISDLFIENTYDYNFVGLVSQAILHAYTHDLSFCQGVIKNFVMDYTELGRSYARLGRPSQGRIYRRYHYLRRILQVHWLSVLSSLRMAIRRGPESPSLRASLQDITSHWERLGRAYSFDERSGEARLGLTDYLTPEEKLLGCFFAECPCYGHKPLHGFRRVCKGCWAVYYCGKECQKKDWIKTHKALCTGGSRPMTD